MSDLKQLQGYLQHLQEYLFQRGWQRKPQKEISIHDQFSPDPEILRGEEPGELKNTQPRLKLPSFAAERDETEIPSNPEVTKIARIRSNHAGIQLGTRWVFKVVAGLDLGRQYLATTAEIKIGRKPENHIYLRDPKVSRFHAVVKVDGSHLTLIDLASTNGTSVNEARISNEKRLMPGDRIKVGETIIQVNSQPW